MAAKENVTISTQFTTSAREVDFVTRFNDNWDALRTILGIMRPIRKAPGTKLVSYKAEVDGDLQGGATVAEGDEIPFTKMKVSPVTYGDIEVAKYAKSVTIESVAKYGAEVAVEKTDDAFLVALQNKVLGDFYTFLATGSLALTPEIPFSLAYSKSCAFVIPSKPTVSGAVLSAVRAALNPPPG